MVVRKTKTDRRDGQKRSPRDRLESVAGPRTFAVVMPGPGPIASPGASGTHSPAAG
jgi:hypothetical protein